MPQYRIMTDNGPLAFVQAPNADLALAKFADCYIVEPSEEWDADGAGPAGQALVAPLRLQVDDFWNCPGCGADLHEHGFRHDVLATVGYYYHFDGRRATTEGFDTDDVDVTEDPGTFTCTKCAAALSGEQAQALRAILADDDDEGEGASVTDLADAATGEPFVE